MGANKCDFIVALIKTNVKIAKHQWNYMENESNEYKINITDVALCEIANTFSMHSQQEGAREREEALSSTNSIACNNGPNDLDGPLGT